MTSVVEHAAGAAHRVRRRLRTVRALPDERGQAAIELLGAVPAVLLVGLVLLQLLAVGYTAVLAGAAAEAGALALAGGGDPEASARNSLSGRSRARARVTVAGGTVRVRLRPLSPLSFVSRRFEVSGHASVGQP